jgi:hypothetical protein
LVPIWFTERDGLSVWFVGRHGLGVGFWQGVRFRVRITIGTVSWDDAFMAFTSKEGG